ncbi:hypothetical protein Trisim1_008541 [Trichoderma cf. simile WF8]
MGACNMGHGDFSHGSWPVLVMSLYGSSSALPYCVLLYSVLRQRDCIASLRFGCPSAVACGSPVSTDLLHNLDSAMPGADIYIWLLWLALFLSDLHLLPTGHLLVSLKPTANKTGLPLYALPLDPHGQRQAAL